LGYDAIPLGKLFTAFLRNMVPSSTMGKYFGLFDPEHEGTIFRGNVRKHSTTQHHIPKDSIFSLLEVGYFWSRWVTVSFSGRFTVSSNRHSVTPL
jgi:hypothetical protein